MYYFFQVLFKVFFKFIIWLELSLFDCVKQKNPTQNNMPGIIPNDIEIPISIIVKYVSMIQV
jgi:hypothetical protein